MTVSAPTRLSEETKVRDVQIDADSHIEEPDAVFDYLDKDFAHRRPRIIDLGDAVVHRPTRDKAWLIDGELRPKLFGRGPSCYATPPTTKFAALKPIAPAIQSLEDVDGFLGKMDKVPLDMTICYSTLFLHPVTDDERFEAALMASWNSYMHEAASKSNGRIGYGALIPTLDPVLGAKEIYRAKELGASAAMILPAGGRRLLHERMFDPLWEASVDSGLPIAVHVGYSHKGVQESCDSLAAALVLNFEMSMMFGMFSFLAGGILDRYPTLKVAFLEAGSVWLPAILDRLAKWGSTPTAEVWPAQKKPEDYLASGQLYFTVEGDEANLTEFVKLAGPKQILGSADFPHVHYAGGQLGEGFTFLREHTALTAEEKRLILGQNAVEFYGLKSFA
jgi:predicted TIM-barrel fold metal-dependent hydrolase